MENPKIKELIDIIKSYIPTKEIEIITNALDLSIKAHNNQKRKSEICFFENLGKINTPERYETY